MGLRSIFEMVEGRSVDLKIDQYKYKLSKLKNMKKKSIFTKKKAMEHHWIQEHMKLSKIYEMWVPKEEKKNNET